MKKANPYSEEFVEWVKSRNVKFDMGGTLTFEDQPRSEAEFDRIIRGFKRDLYSNRQVFKASRKKAEARDPTKGLKVIITKEGELGINRHIHIAIEIPKGMKAKKFKQAIVNAWRAQRGAGFIERFHAEPDDGWLEYISKEMGQNGFDPLVTTFFNI